MGGIVNIVSQRMPPTRDRVTVNSSLRSYPISKTTAVNLPYWP